MKELIDFLEKKGFSRQANDLKDGTTSLNFRYDQIGDEGARVLAYALKANSSLTTLDLGHNQIKGEGVRWLADALKANSSITTLDLYNNQIGDAGAKVVADALKTNSSITSLDLSGNKIGDTGAKEIEERICYNKELVKKLPLLLCSYFKSNMDADIEFKVLTASKFYKVVNKQLLKESLQEQGIINIESKLKEVENLIKLKSFTIADVCKDIQPDTNVAPGELHISNLPTEIMDNILAYVGDTPWGWKVEAIGNTVEPAG